MRLAFFSARVVVGNREEIRSYGCREMEEQNWEVLRHFWWISSAFVFVWRTGDSHWCIFPAGYNRLNHHSHECFQEWSQARLDLHLTRFRCCSTSLKNRRNPRWTTETASWNATDSFVMFEWSMMDSRSNVKEVVKCLSSVSEVVVLSESDDCTLDAFFSEKFVRSCE